MYFKLSTHGFFLKRILPLVFYQFFDDGIAFKVSDAFVPPILINSFVVVVEHQHQGGHQCLRSSSPIAKIELAVEFVEVFVRRGYSMFSSKFEDNVPNGCRDDESFHLF